MRKFLIRTRYLLNEIKRKIFYTLKNSNDIHIGRKNIFIFLVADYGNIGDIAITYAQKEFVKRYLPDYNVIEIGYHDTHKYLPYLHRKIKPQDIVTIIGGGNMTDRYDDIEESRRMVIKAFRNNKIISFPQTIEFTNTIYGEEAKKRSKKIYSKCKNLVVLAREKKSYLMMKELYSENIIKLIPDIVIFLKGKLPIETSKIRQGIGICFRYDKEAAIDNNLKKKIIECLDKNEIEHLSTYIEDSIFRVKDKETNFLELLNKISSKQIFITDRLHGMIFCYLTNTPCIVFDNDNHKISETYKLWFKDCSYIKMLEEDDITDFEEIISEMKKIEIQDTNLEDKYEELKVLLQE